MNKLTLWVSVMALFITSSVFANQNPQPQTVEVGSWHLSASFGYGELTSPLTDQDDIKLYVMPDIRYYGERFSIENTSIGYSLKETHNYSVSLVGILNQDGLFFPGNNRNLVASIAPPLSVSIFPTDSSNLEKNNDAPEVYPPEKSLSYMAGVAWRYYGAVELSASLTADVTAGHHGEELSFSAKKQFHFGDILLEPKLGITHKGSALVDYYYAVSNDQMPLGFKHLSYDPSSATNWHMQLQVGYPLDEKLWLVSSFRYDNNASEISNSPIVNKDNFHSYFIGVKWGI